MYYLRSKAILSRIVPNLVFSKSMINGIECDVIDFYKDIMSVNLTLQRSFMSLSMPIWPPIDALFIHDDTLLVSVILPSYYKQVCDEFNLLTQYGIVVIYPDNARPSALVRYQFRDSDVNENTLAVFLNDAKLFIGKIYGIDTSGSKIYSTY